MMVSKTFASMLKALALFVLCVLLIHTANGKVHHHKFVIKSSSFTRLCSAKNILTVNGEFPGPTLKAHRGDTLIVKVYNRATYNITLHWHGAKQLRNPWSDGPEYITQCPIQTGKMFKYTIHLSKEEGTIWWHAHSGWARATVHGAFIIYPKRGHHYPFPKPHAEVPIILGEWWKKEVMSIPIEANKTGGEPILSNAYTINGQPGYLYPCSKKDTFKMMVEHGKTYLLRVINAVMDEELFFTIAKHKLTVVGKDGSYLKPIKTEFIMITPGQSMDILLEANQLPGKYFMAGRSYSSAFGAGFDNTTTTGLLIYHGASHHHKKRPRFLLPKFPPYNETKVATKFTKQFRSLATKTHPTNVPLKVDTHLLFTISVNLLNCSTDKPCSGPFGKRFAASINNISLVNPSIDFLRAYYYNIPGVFEIGFPRTPDVKFNYTGDNLPEYLLTPEFGTKVLVVEYNANVEIVFQGTNVLASDNHPVHLHGYSFYVVGWGFGNFDHKKDPENYNLVDPPEETTVGVPKDGWVAIRFRANNPGLWLLHCHIERHASWGMSMVLLVKGGPNPQTQMLPPPKHLPKC